MIAFLRGCWGFYATILIRYVEPDDLPTRKKTWTDGTF